MRHKISNEGFENARVILQPLVKRSKGEGGFTFPCGVKIAALHVADGSLETLNCGDKVAPNSNELCSRCYSLFLDVLAGNYDADDLSLCQRMVNFAKTHPKLMVSLGVGFAVLAGLGMYSSVAIASKISALSGNDATLATEQPNIAKSSASPAAIATTKAATTTPAQTKAKTEAEHLQEKWSKCKDTLPLLFQGSAIYDPNIGYETQFLVFKKNVGYTEWRKPPKECDVMLAEAEKKPRKKFQIVVQSREKKADNSAGCNIDIKHPDVVRVGVYEVDGFKQSPPYVIPNDSKKNGNIVFAGFRARLTEEQKSAGQQVGTVIGVLNHNTFQTFSEYKEDLKNFVTDATHNARSAGFGNEEFNAEIAKLIEEFRLDKYQGFGFVDAINTQSSFIWQHLTATTTKPTTKPITTTTAEPTTKPAITTTAEPITTTAATTIATNTTTKPVIQKPPVTLKFNPKEVFTR